MRSAGAVVAVVLVATSGLAGDRAAERYESYTMVGRLSLHGSDAPGHLADDDGHDGHGDRFTERLGSTSPGALLAGLAPVVPARVLDTRSGNGAPSGKLGPSGTIELTVVGRGGVPASGVDAVALNMTVTEASAPSFVTVWPTGVARPDASSLNMVPGQTVPNLVIAKVGAGGTVSIRNAFGSTHVVADVVGWSGSEPHLRSLAPARLLDTRAGNGAPVGKLGPNGTIDLAVAGRGGVPQSGAGAVILNVTVTEPSAASFVTVWPTGEQRPAASSLNMLPGETNPNLVVAKVGTGGRVSLFNRFGSTHLVADVVGWLPTGGAYEPINPTRVLDSRTGAGVYGTVQYEPEFGFPFLRPKQLDFFTGLGPDETVQLQVAGPLGLPRTVTTVLVNLTATEATAPTFVTAWAFGDDRPQASSSNLVPGVSVPNLVLVEVGDGGYVNLYNRFGRVHLVADVVGYFVAHTADDQPDDVPGNQIHVVHAIPSDRSASFDRADIEHTLDLAETWLEDEGGRGFRFDTDGGEIEITTHRLGMTAAQVVESIEADFDPCYPECAEPPAIDLWDRLRADGFGNPRKKYLIHVDGVEAGSLCGVADDLLALVFSESCFARPDRTATFSTFGAASTGVHELLHTLGAVSFCAPNRSGRGHAADESDIMHATTRYTVTTGPSGQTVEFDPVFLDPGRDDYWGFGGGSCPSGGDSPPIPWPDLSLSPFLDAPR